MNRSGLFLALLAIIAGLFGCASAPNRTEVFDTVAVLDHDRDQLIAVARDQMGTPYRYGGADQRGFDCSGLVQYVHRQIGLRVPRTTKAQLRNARPIPVSHIQAGDLVFFDIDEGKGRHVGIYEGAGRFIHAPSSGKRVSRSSVHNPYWRSRLIGVGSYF